MAGRFPRVETRRRAAALVRGLLADLPRKNCWTIAEHTGDRNPHGSQHLLARASWDTDGARDDLRDYVVGALGDATRCWWWTRPATSRRAPTRAGCSASTPARPGGSRTPGSRSTWITLAPVDT